MKKIILLIFTLTLAISLTACDTDFNGSRTENDSEFIMEYTTFNTTDTQELIVESGDTINGKIVVENGNLAIKIQKDSKNQSMKVMEFLHLTSLILKLMKVEHIQLQ